MRNVALLVSILVMGAAFAGCFGSEEDDPKTASVDPAPGTGTEPGTVTLPDGGLRVLAALSPTIVTDAPAWIKSGTKINVSGTASSNAKGTVTYTWTYGPLPGTAEVASRALDTKAIQPGAESRLKFPEAGVFNMHCHPHPAMVHNVTVVEGYSGPSTVTVYITDGSETSQYRFVPSEAVIPVGGTVVYKNAGTLMHTSTQSGQEPALKSADLSASGGEMTLEGNGWQRIRLVTQDADGRIGFAEHRIYVTPELPAFEPKKIEGDLRVGLPSAAPAQAHETATDSFKLAHSGKLYLNFTATDPIGDTSGQVSLAQIEIHLKEQGATQDTLTVDPAGAGSADAIVGAKTYTISITGAQGAAIHYVVDITVEYDLVPPEPAMASAGGGGDAHGGHAH